MRNRDEPLILKLLAAWYDRVRDDIDPPYPYDETTGEVRLPLEIQVELRDLLREDNKPAAVKRVAELTGAGLRGAKDYVDALDVTPNAAQMDAIDLPPDVDAEVRDLVNAGRTIEAIKRIREASDAGLAAAKAYVERL